MMKHIVERDELPVRDGTVITEVYFLGERDVDTWVFVGTAYVFYNQHSVTIVLGNEKHCFPTRMVSKIKRWFQKDGATTEEIDSKMYGQLYEEIAFI